MSEAAKPRAIELVVERTLKASRDKVWRCWTEPKLLGEWFCPKPWRAEITSQDLRAGGGQTMTLHGPEGEHMDLAGIYLEVKPQEKLVSTSAIAEGWIPVNHPEPGFPELQFVELSDAPGGGTFLRWGARHWTEEAKKQHEAMGFEQGWNICVDQLDALAQTL
jgi:uncharacterized protein YndB with AHSA1/START domain